MRILFTKEVKNLGNIKQVIQKMENIQNWTNSRAVSRYQKKFYHWWKKSRRPDL